MDLRAEMTSKCPATIPQRVREALECHQGDDLTVRVECSRALLAETSDFLELAGAVAVPADKRGIAWDKVLRRTRRERADHPAPRSSSCSRRAAMTIYA